MNGPLVCISAEAYRQMLNDQGIAVLDEERQALHEHKLQLEAELKQVNRKITAISSTIAALHLRNNQ